jgi:NADPH:quinone reductase-like Zn-dependent oxidoreductase
MPSNLNFQEASTLSCAALTAWNALFGLESKALKPGQTVLTQGTGGVSIFAVQFAKLMGAKVIATTSSADKAEEEAAKLTPNGGGVHHVVEVGGPATMAQSLKAVTMEGVVSIIGFIGGLDQEQPRLLECLQNICTVRGILVGSRLQFEDMNAAIEANDLHPVVDEKVFELSELKEAYQYMWDQKHFGKLTIKIA